MRETTRTWLLAVVGGLAAAAAGAVDLRDTRLLAQPAITEGRVAFAYDDDLWIADVDGGGARRLTSHEGVETSPRFSPDGRLVAFSGNYDGNTDVYVVAVEGGAPRRLTWHPGTDLVQGFTPDGSAVLFVSQRSVHTNRHTQLFTVPVAGGFPSRLPIPNGLRASYNHDGTKIAYIPVSEAHTQWKNYRGGRTSRIWLYDTRDHSVEEVPQPQGRCNDTDPLWVGDRVFFRSDRNGEFNLFSYRPGGAEVRQWTHFEDFPVLDAERESAVDGSELVFEQAGYLHVLDTTSGDQRRLRIAVPADLKETRPRFASGARYIRGASLSPSGARAVFAFRGEILTLPAEKGDPRNLTRTTSVHEHSPAWSPSGASIAYFSDASGEYRLHVAPQDGRGEPRAYDLEGHGFYRNLAFSPDGRWVSYADNSWSLYILDLESGEARKIGSEMHYGPQRADTLHADWSPDSKWLVYTLQSPAYIQTVHIYSIESGESFAVGEGLSEVSEPVFDPQGRFLAFFASTDAGPVKQWFAMSNADMEVSRSLYLAVLAAGEASPLAPESDEEPVREEGAESDDEEDGEDDDEPGGDVRIDREGLAARIIALPVEAGNYSNLAVARRGKILFVADAGEDGSLQMYDLEEREQSGLLDGGVRSFVLSGDRWKLLYRTNGGWGIAPAGQKIDPGETKLDVASLEVRVDPLAEWPQIFDEAWRVNRDYFYDPNMHGADWEAMREKYAQFLPDVVTRRDLNRVMQWMFSELAVGHHRVGGGDSRVEVDTIPGGLLGADFEIADNRYRFAKVLGGLNWNPDLRAPLTEPGVGVVAGEYLLAVEGRELFADENVFARFEKTAGKNVEITVGPSPDGDGSRTVTVVPIEDEGALRNRDWVEANLRKVDAATDGRVAYVYLPNTTGLGHTYFKRYFFPQVHKEAIIIDERYNGGGQVADYYIDHLRRPFISMWATRYGQDIETPGGAIQGPKVMLIDETAGSGGDLLPWMFRKLGLGTLVGKR
ncbi:MAG: PDZ domain-containing protein, partial [Thermoanaerobaculia bacterium]|nr:PDZ domain-containing protein [Thermoanaerobaculia bacterium]